MVHDYGDSQVLVLGHANCVKVANNYGFRRVFTADCVYHRTPSIFPNRVLRTDSTTTPRSMFMETEPVRAVMIFHDPTDWALEMQLLSDLLSVNSQYGGGAPIPLFACNADLIYTTEHPSPRFTQGAFIESFRHLYELHHGTPLQMTCFGKPHKIQYDYAERMLQREARLTHPSQSPLEQQQQIYFGVGDNPRSDIRGANGAGSHWRSVLVRTGVFQGALNDATDPADYVEADVEKAVDLIVNY